MEEQTYNVVLARRQNKAFFFALGWVLAGAAVLAVGIYALLSGVFSASEENAGVEYFFIVFGALLLAWGVVMFVLVVRVPAVVAEDRGERLLFCGREYPVSEIAGAQYRVTYTSRLFTEPYGTLVLQLAGGQSVKCRYVASVAGAAERINALAAAAKAEDAPQA